MREDLISEEIECHRSFNFRTTERIINIDEDEIDDLSKCYDIQDSSTNSLYEFLVELYDAGDSHCICDHEELEDIKDNRDELISFFQRELKSRLSP